MLQMQVTCLQIILGTWKTEENVYSKLTLCDILHEFKIKDVE